MWGIDVSHHQGFIEWRKVKKYGVQFAILKAMRETTHTPDTRFAYNYYQCENEGIDIGVYCYVIATSKEAAVKEAHDLLKILDGRLLQRGIWLDMEDVRIKSLGKDKLTAIMQIEREIFVNAGYTVGIYSNVDWYLNVLDGKNLIHTYDWWIARYPKHDTGEIKMVLRPDVTVSMWQYSSKGSVDGILGAVDMNYDVSDLSKSVEQLAQEVIEGKWGNGEIRKNRLEAAGYDFILIQNRVTQILHEKKYFNLYQGSSWKIDEVFIAIGVPSKYIGHKDKRRPIAIANGMENYSGNIFQNLKLIDLAKKGQLLKPQ